MPVVIKKVIRDSKGQVIEEYEGTESEIESYEKKKEKKQQSEQAKKERKLLLEAKKTLGSLTKKDLLQMIEELLTKHLSNTTTVYHHWYYHNGYWWKPHFDSGRWVYQYSTTNPHLYPNQWVTCNSVSDLTKSTGLNANQVYTSIASGPAQITNTAQNDLSAYKVSINTSGNNFGSVGSSVIGTSAANTTLLSTTNNAIDTKSFTSGMINANIKS